MAQFKTLKMENSQESLEHMYDTEHVLMGEGKYLQQADKLHSSPEEIDQVEQSPWWLAPAVQHLTWERNSDDVGSGRSGHVYFSKAT